jgi:ribonuclease E
MAATAAGAPATETRAPRGERNEGRRGPRGEREPRPAAPVTDEAPLTAQAFVDTLPIAPVDAAADTGERDAGRRRRRRGGRGRGRDEGDGAEAVSPIVDEPQGSEQAVDSAPIAVESVLADQVPRSVEFAPAAPRRDEDSEMAIARVPVPVPVPAPTPAPIVVAAPPALPVTAPVPVAAPYRLPTDSLAAMASDAGLQWVNSDAEKIRAVQEAMANEPKPVRAPRAPKPRVVIDDGPLVLIETKKDLAQVRLPFDSNPPPAAP